MVKKKSLAESNTQKENDNTLEYSHNNQEEEQVEVPKQSTDTALAKNKTKNKTQKPGIDRNNNDPQLSTESCGILPPRQSPLPKRPTPKKKEALASKSQKSTQKRNRDDLDDEDDVSDSKLSDEDEVSVGKPAGTKAFKKKRTITQDKDDDISMLIEEEDPFLGFIEVHPPKPDVPLLEQELVLPSDELCTRKKNTLSADSPGPKSIQTCHQEKN
jgi:hypothetical protein